MIDRPSGTEGYTDDAPALARQYESIAFADVHRQVMFLIPPAPARIVDIGAGTGRDAASFAAMGHVVMLTAVWMHLDERQRRRAMPRVAGLVRLGGVMMLSPRYGPVPPGRRMFDVGADDTIQLARAEGLTLLLRLDHQDGQPRIIEAPNARRDGRTCCGHHEWQTAAPDGRHDGRP